MQTNSSWKNLFVSISTYTQPSLITGVTFLQKTFETFLLPCLNDQEIVSQIYWKPSGGKKHKSAFLQNFDWNTLLEFPLIDNLMVGCKLKNWSGEARTSPYLGEINVRFILDPVEVYSLEFSISKRLLGDTIPLAVQSQAISLALSTFQEIDGFVGYITVDYLSASSVTTSPCELLEGVSYLQPGKSRGYYWGNILSQTLVENLGGIHLLNKAPVFLVQNILRTSSYYLQLTENINNIDRFKLAELKEFLKPILPQRFLDISQEYRESLSYFQVIL